MEVFHSFEKVFRSNPTRLDSIRRTNMSHIGSMYGICTSVWLNFFVLPFGWILRVMDVFFKPCLHQVATVHTFHPLHCVEYLGPEMLNKHLDFRKTISGFVMLLEMCFVHLGPVVDCIMYEQTWSNLKRSCIWTSMDWGFCQNSGSQWVNNLLHSSNLT